MINSTIAGACMALSEESRDPCHESTDLAVIPTVSRASKLWGVVSVWDTTIYVLDLVCVYVLVCTGL